MIGTRPVHGSRKALPASIPLLAALSFLAPTSPAGATASPSDAHRSRTEPEVLLVETRASGKLHIQYSDQAIERAWVQARALGADYTREEIRKWLSAPPFTLDEYLEALDHYGWGLDLTDEGFAAFRSTHPELGQAWDILAMSWIIYSHQSQPEPGQLENWGEVSKRSRTRSAISRWTW